MYSQVFEFTSRQGQDSLDDRLGSLSRITPDIEVTSTLVEEIGDLTPLGAWEEQLQLVVDSLLLA